VVSLLAFSAAAQVPGDARRGAETFRAQGCIACHGARGEGAKAAPDLGAPTGRTWEPPQMAARMWNQAPEMWTTMRQLGMAPPRPSAQDAADLFAYFFGARHFQSAGNAERGRRLTDRRCAGCHAPSGGASPAFSPAVLEDPIALAGRLWNHAAGPESGGSHARLSARELSDIVEHKHSLAGGGPLQPAFSPGAPQAGLAVFRAKCSACHRYAPTNPYPTRSLADFQAAMWNHVPGKEPLPALSSEEMRAVVGYLWSQHYFDERGSVENGRRVFTQKRCTTCHAYGSADPARLDGHAVPQASWSMVQAAWEHGPAMAARMERDGFSWPRFEAREMADLISYLASLRWLRVRPSPSPKR
jgi:cytochrome c2